LKFLKSFKFWFWFVAFLGVLLRLRGFFAFRSLWLDEVALLLQIRGRSYEELFFNGVAGNQGAPAAYLVISKAVMSQFSSFEVGARLLSLVSGISALFVSAWLVMVSFRDSFSRVFALFAISVSPWLIFYSAEGKHYMLEALVALLVVCATIQYERHKLSLIVLIIVGVVSVWFSHNAPVVLCACGTILIFRSWVARDWKAAGTLVVVCGVWVVSFTLHASTNMRALFGNQELFTYWRHGLAPWHDGVLAAGRWIVHVWGALMAYIFMPPGSHGSTDAVFPLWLGGWEGLLVAVVALGLTRMFRERSLLAPYAALILAVSFSLSLLRVSPFSARLVLYLVPFILIAAASGVAAMIEIARNRYPLLSAGAVALALLVMGPSVATSTERFVRPLNRSNMKAALRYLSETRAPEDLVMMRRVDSTVAAMYIRRDRSLEMPVLDANWKIVNAPVMCNRLKKRLVTVPGRSVWIVGVLQAEEVSHAIDILGRDCVAVTSRFESDGFVAARIEAR
jgi:hypothetical protein